MYFYLSNIQPIRLIKQGTKIYYSDYTMLCYSGVQLKLIV